MKKEGGPIPLGVKLIVRSLYIVSVLGILISLTQLFIPFSILLSEKSSLGYLLFLILANGLGFIPMVFRDFIIYLGGLNIITLETIGFYIRTQVYFTIVFGLFYLFVGRNLMKGKNWARTILITFLVITLILSLLRLNSVNYFISTMLGLMVAIYVIFNKNAKAFFTENVQKIREIPTKKETFKNFLIGKWWLFIIILVYSLLSAPSLIIALFFSSYFRKYFFILSIVAIIVLFFMWKINHGEKLKKWLDE